MQDQPARVGLDPVDRVFLMENHDQAYHVWRDAGSTDKILVHVDAHHDMWWKEDDEPLTIANFIAPALKDGLIREVVWVVPDATWRTVEGREAVERHVQKIARTFPDGRQPVHDGVDTIRAQVLGKPLTISSLDRLPAMNAEMNEGVVLDIDVDFFVIPSVSNNRVDEHSALPWCWPADLIARLRARDVRADLATIAYSVEGGYTPLEWKYLGDELAALLRAPATRDPVRGPLRAMELMREGAEAEGRGDVASAERALGDALAIWPASAAPDYRLAYLHEGAGQLDAGRRFYRQAVAKDSSYRTPYGTAGFNHYWSGRISDAGREFERTLELDAEHAGALLGLGMVTARQRRWTDAEALLRRSLAANAELIETHRQLAALLVRRREYQEAILEYERSLALAMAGHRLFGWPLAPTGHEGRLIDGDHWKIHARLARLHERQGNLARAVAGYQISLAAGYGGAPLQRRLDRLHERQRQTVSG